MIHYLDKINTLRCVTLRCVLLCGMALMLSGSAARGAEFFVDAVRGSNETGRGDKVRPWRSVQFAVSRMKPGDICTLRAGIYRETVVPRDGQKFRAYPGEKAIISGCDSVKNWKPGIEGRFEAPVAATVRQLFVKGTQMSLARYPNDTGDRYSTADWAETSAERGVPAQTGSARVTFTAGLRGKSFDGGFYTGLNGLNPFQANMGRIVATEGDTVRCDRTNLRWYRSLPGQFDGSGRGYIIDHINALDAPGEWYWGQGTLSFVPPPGTAWQQNVEARVRLYGFDCSQRRGVVIEGLVFQAAAVLMDGSQSCVIDACDFYDVSPWGRFFEQRPNGDPEHYTYGNPEDGTAGIYINGQRNLIQNCRVSRGWGALITVRGSENTVLNNLVQEANWQCREFAVNIVVNGTNNRILNNTLRQSTAMLIVMIDIDRIAIAGTLIKGNDCRDYGYIMADGGTAAIYRNGNNDAGGLEISYNVIAGNRTTNQRVSSGIYLDDGSNNFYVHHNLILGSGQTRSGLFTHRGHERMWVYNNTFWGQQQAAWVSALWEGERDAATMIYRNNLSSGPGFATNGVRGGITQDHNREYVPASDFEDVAAEDFRLHPTATPSDLGAYEQGTGWKAGATIFR